MPISSRRLLRQRSAEQKPKLVKELEVCPSSSSLMLPGLEPSESSSDEDCYYSDASDLSTATASLTRVGAQGPARRTIRFGHVDVRSYELVVGDHPCCVIGCPLQLGWNVQQQKRYDVNDYEARRASVRRSHHDLRMGADERRERLLESVVVPELSGCSSPEPQEAPQQPQEQRENQQQAVLKQREGEIRHACRLQHRLRDRRQRRSENSLFFQRLTADV